MCDTDGVDHADELHGQRQLRGRAGGGLNNNFGATTTMTNCTVSGNTAAGDGGGLSDVAGTITMTNCTVSGNSASTSGGGVYNLASHDADQLHRQRQLRHRQRRRP